MQSLNFRIVPLRAEQLPAVAELEKECFSHPWSLQSLKTESAAAGAHFLAAMADGKMVGYAGMTTVLDEASVTNIAVTKPFRRCGIGRALLQRQKQICRESGMAFLTLEVRASNRAAIALYESEGFAEVGRRKQFYTEPQEDALLMTCWFNGRKGAE